MAFINFKNVNYKKTRRCSNQTQTSAVSLTRVLARACGAQHVVGDGAEVAVQVAALVAVDTLHVDFTQLCPEVGFRVIRSGNFSDIFFWGKSLSAENSVEFLGKMIFQNFFRGKLYFFPTFLGKNFPLNFPHNFPRKKIYEKSAPDWANFLGDCFTLRSFFNESKFWATFFQDKSSILILTKNGLG
jgi:hypothetical protein